MVQVASGIAFEHWRVKSEMVGGNFMLTAPSKIKDITPFGIHDLSIDRRAVKEYQTYAHNRSFYYPYGMDGPRLQIVGSYPGQQLACISEWDEVFTNDILKVVSFNYPYYARVISEGSQWWVDSTEVDAQPGWVRAEGVRYMLTLNLYKLGATS